jgi:hypothetical protein
MGSAYGAKYKVTGLAGRSERSAVSRAKEGDLKCYGSEVEGIPSK